MSPAPESDTIVRAARPVHGRSEQPEISLIIPALDEEDGIVASVSEAVTALECICSRWEIIVVDDGSRDETQALVRTEFSEDPRVRLEAHEENIGYGAALRTGFNAARFSLIGFTDADRQFYVEDLSRLLARLEGHDAVCGYRANRADPPLRLLYAKVYNVLVRALLGLKTRDCDCALKLFRRRVLSQLEIEADGFLVNAEILAKLRCNGVSIAEVDVRHRRRVDGTSTVSLARAVPVFSALIRLAMSLRRPTSPLSERRDADA